MIKDYTYMNKGRKVNMKNEKYNDNKFIELFNYIENVKKATIMDENIKKLNLYSEQNDIIDNYLNYWILYKYGFTKNEIDKLWLQDSRYSFLRNDKNNIHADTIFSAWNPLKKYIELTGKVEINETNKISKDINTLLIIKELKKEGKLFENKDELYNSLINFLKSASTVGNVIEYPSYLNGTGNKTGYFQKRGGMFSDLFLKSLYECFDDGKFSFLFGNKGSNYKNVSGWIQKQKLEMFFNDEKNINKDNIIRIYNDECKVIQCCDDINWSNITDKNDFKRVIEKYTKLINERFKRLNKELNK
jgi:hypothetical protein